jgi:hypothetical protein
VVSRRLISLTSIFSSVGNKLRRCFGHNPKPTFRVKALTIEIGMRTTVVEVARMLRLIEEQR